MRAVVTDAPRHAEEAVPLFSLVVAVYNSLPYLDAFLASLEVQSFGLDRVQIILVDDGSTDASLDLCRTFAARHRSTIVLTRPNGGPGAARNTGLDAATGTWVSFPDPDDLLTPDYLRHVADFLARHDDVEIAATPLIRFLEEQGSLRDTHPLRFKFAQGTRVIDLADEPEAVQLSSGTAFLRRDLIESRGLRFDELLRPDFEDAHLIARYLLRSDRPALGVVAEAHYHYRKRPGAVSLADGSWARSGKYDVVPRRGFVDLLDQARTLLGGSPRWLENLLLYNLAWYLRADEKVSTPLAGQPPAVIDSFLQSLAEILPRLSPDAVHDFSIVRVSEDARFVLAHAHRPVPAHDAPRIDAHDLRRGLVRVRYRHVGPAPREELRRAAGTVEPMFEKSRTLSYFGAVLARERILWVAAGDRMELVLDDTMELVIPADVLETRREAETRQRPPWLRDLAEPLRRRLLPDLAALLRRPGKPALFELLVSVLIHSPWGRRRRGGWVLQDRIGLAGDNAEHLYRAIRSAPVERPVHFVLDRRSPDWRRLRRDGFRLVPYGSLRWHALLLVADQLASSQVSPEIVAPHHPQRFGAPRYAVTFLQHGVIKDDVSRWLGGKAIDLFITSTAAEAASIADESGYPFTRKEVQLTGLPRFDALRRRRLATPPGERRLLLIMPTWRNHLSPASIAEIARSEFAGQVNELIGSADLSRIAAERDLELLLMPHPNLESAIDAFTIPSDVRVGSYARDEVQELLARAALLVTDYSSMAFNAAWIQTPVVYFQFDRDTVLHGSHIMRPGYFSYQDHGFGPVTTTVDEAVSAIAETARVDARPDSRYLARMRGAFPSPDEANAQRVIDAMRALDQGRPSGR